MVQGWKRRPHARGGCPYAPVGPTSAVAFPIRLLAVVLGFLGSSHASETGRGDHETRVMAGWTVHVSRKLLAQEPAATAAALEILRAQLEGITRVVPAPAVRALREVPSWLSPEYAGILPKAEYHPSAQWLSAHGRAPAMARAVEFTNVRIFAAEARRMPVFVLHELAHAYHHMILGHGHAGIRDAFARAQAGGAYERVERQDAAGRKQLARAYALTNAQKYFAEGTEAFFGRNDFFPYTREQLKAHDPDLYAVLGDVWGAGISGANLIEAAPR